MNAREVTGVIDPMPVDFIEVTYDLLARDACARIVERMRRGDALLPGSVGGAVHPALKDSRDLQVTATRRGPKSSRP